MGSLLSFSGIPGKCTHNEFIRAQNSTDDVRDNMSFGTKGKREEHFYETFSCKPEQEVKNTGS